MKRCKMCQCIINTYVCWDTLTYVGDFNSPSISWSSLNSNVMPAEEMFMDVVDFYSLEQINSVPSNVHGKLIDLVFKIMCEMYSNVSAYDSPLNTHDSLFNTDHTLLVFYVITKPKCKAASKRVVFNYRKANFTDICNHLQKLDLSKIARDCKDVNTAWEDWSCHINNAITTYVPKRNVKRSYYTPWCDSETRRLIEKKRSLWHRAKHGKNKRLWNRFKNLRRKAKVLLKKKYDTYVLSLGDKCKDNSQFFGHFFSCRVQM